MYELLTFSLAALGVALYIHELHRIMEQRRRDRSAAEKVFQWRKEIAIQRARGGYSTIIDS